MAVFPATRTLIVPPSQLWSRGKTVTMAGAAKTNYPASNATDGYSGRATRSEYVTESWIIDLTTARTPNIFGILHSNVTRGLVCAFQAASSLSFSPLLLDRGAAARYPNFWLDLRGFPPTARYYRFGVNSNAKAVALGEIVIATGFEFEGTLQSLPSENVRFWQERALLETGKLAISASGAHTRALELQLEMTADDVTNLEQVFVEAADSADPIVVVPDTRKNDIYYVHWPEQRELRYERSDIAEIRTTLSLVEASAGVI